MKPEQISTIMLITGTFFTSFISAFKLEGGFDFTILVLVTGPLLILDALFPLTRWARGIAITAGLMLAFELLIHYTVFEHPQSSTDPA